MVSGRKLRSGEISRGAAEGLAVDEVFKDRLRHALKGRLNRWSGILSPTAQGKRGPDVVPVPWGLPGT
jgi:hypothetical protein